MTTIHRYHSRDLITVTISVGNQFTNYMKPENNILHTALTISCHKCELMEKTKLHRQEKNAKEI